MTSDYSLSDIAAAMGNDGGGFGGGSAWWIIILFLFAFMNGGLGGNNSGIMENYTINSDFTQLLNRVNQIGDSLGNGIADATFALNNSINTGFSQGQIAAMQNTNQLMQAVNSVSHSVDNGFANVNYNTQNQTCQLSNTIQTGTRDILDGQNASTRAILDAITQNKIDALQEKIACLTADNQALRFGASQTAQNTYLVNALKPSCCNQCFTS